jgi:hypothetical protein
MYGMRVSKGKFLNVFVPRKDGLDGGTVKSSVRRRLRASARDTNLIREKKNRTEKKTEEKEQQQQQQQQQPEETTSSKTNNNSQQIQQQPI